MGIEESIFLTAKVKVESQYSRTDTSAIATLLFVSFNNVSGLD